MAMADLTFIEKSNLERLFGMGSGYVLTFSNRTFEEFVSESVGKNIFDPKYNNGSGSKANRLRAFWRLEPNHIVGKLLADLIAYALRDLRPGQIVSDEKGHLYKACDGAAQRLIKSAAVAEADALVPNSSGVEFDALAKAVRIAIASNQPEAGLDRLHTFVVKYLRTECANHGISIDRDKPLHSLMGEYIKALKQEGILKSEMTERILKSSISLLEAFNHVRNEQSLAHDNRILGYNESLLIFNQVASVIRFLRALEEDATAAPVEVPDPDEPPF